MPYAKATTHVYVNMVGKRKHLHMRKYPRLQYLLQGKTSLREDIEAFQEAVATGYVLSQDSISFPLFFCIENAFNAEKKCLNMSR